MISMELVRTQKFRTCRTLVRICIKLILFAPSVSVASEDAHQNHRSCQFDASICTEGIIDTSVSLNFRWSHRVLSRMLDLLELFLTVWVPNVHYIFSLVWIKSYVVNQITYMASSRRMSAWNAWQTGLWIVGYTARHAAALAIETEWWHRYSNVTFRVFNGSIIHSVSYQPGEVWAYTFKLWLVMIHSEHSFQPNDMKQKYY